LASGGIEASFNGGAYQTIVASPSGGTYSGTLTGQTIGQGTLTVRAIADPAGNTSKSMIGLGDIYIVIGDSNHSGRATTSTVAPVPANGITAIEFARDDNWKPLQESITSTGSFDDPNGQGSYFGALSNLILTNAAVPVAFVTCAVGSTNLNGWGADTSHGTNPFWLYGQALGKAIAVGTTHKAMLCLLGTNQIAESQAAHETYYNNLINSWYAATGAPTVVYLAIGADANNNAAVAAVLGSNSHALAGPTFVGAWSGTHYLTSSEINVAAGRAWTALQTLFY
jgi:Carbohydrate esterase, sialic acid-specific acetylesterase